VCDFERLVAFVQNLEGMFNDFAFFDVLKSKISQKDHGRPEGSERGKQ